MGNNHDYIALDWVRGEIEDTLHQARQALEAYVDNPDDTAKIRFCLNYIHQVHGTLQMVEFYGAALMAEEMEKLCQAMLSNEAPHKQEALEVLMQSILQLPGYLEHLTAGRKDLPMTLLPALNDIRAARGETLLSDTSLFTPDLSVIDIAPPAGVNLRLQDEKILQNLKKLRQMFQFSLASIIRQKDIEHNLTFLHKVVSKLVKFCQGTAHHYLWGASLAFIESIQDEQIDLSSSSKRLLRDMDHLLKKMIEENVDILVQPIPQDFLKHLLYYIAKSDCHTPQVDAIREAFKLDQSLPEAQQIDEAEAFVQGPDKDALKSVVAALNEELARIKDQLDLYVRSEFKENSDLEEILPSMLQVANTMAVLGLGIPRKVLLEQIALLEQYKDSTDAVDDAVLMDVAGALLYVEASLSGLSDTPRHRLSPSQENSSIPSQQIGSAQDALLREARNGVEQVKNAIVNYMGSQWDAKEIENVPTVLNGLRGSLEMIPLSQVAQLLKSCADYISQVLLQDKVIPDWEQLDILADAITSIEYYLERLSEGATENDQVLKIAEDSVAALGFPSGQEPTYTPILKDEVSMLSEDEEAELGEVAAKSAAPLSSSEKEMDKDLIDDEILEIFIEEAAEVLETIDQFYPEYRQDQDNANALTEIRRAFHTLKGSGRLVGASVLGELAWSVENMLNRVIDHSITPTLAMFELIDEVIALLPELIKDFEQQKPSKDTSDLMQRADAISEAKKVAEEEADNASDTDEVPAEEFTPDAESSESFEEVSAPESVEASEVEEVEAFSAEELPADESTSDDIPTVDEKILETAEATDDLESFDVEEVDAFAADELPTEEVATDELLAGDEETLEAADATDDLESFDVEEVDAFAAEELPAEEVTTDELSAGEEESLEAAEATDDLESFDVEEVDAFAAEELPAEEVTTDELSAGEEESLEAAEATDDLESFDVEEVDAFAAEELPVEEVTTDELSAGDEESLEAAEAADDLESFEAEEVGAFTSDELPAEELAADEASDLTEFAELSEQPEGDELADEELPLLEETEDAFDTLEETIDLSEAEEIAELTEETEDSMDLEPELEPESDLEATEAIAEENEPSQQEEEIPQAQATEEHELIDDEIIEIFLEEAEEVLEAINEHLPQYFNEPDNRESLSEVRRAFHTLKGSGRMVGATVIGELAWSIENLFNRIIDGSTFLNDDIVATVQTVVSMLPELVEDFKMQRPTSQDTEFWRLRAEALASGEMVDPVSPPEPEVEAHTPESEAHKSDFDKASDVAEESFELDADLLEIFKSEADSHLETLEAFIDSLDEEPAQLFNDEISRALHTLKGSANTASIQSIAQIAIPLEKFVKEARANGIPINNDIAEMLKEALRLLKTCSERLAQQHMECLEETPVFLEHLATLTTRVFADQDIEPISTTIKVDPQLVNIFLTEGIDILLDAENILNHWSQNTHDTGDLEKLVGELRTLHNGAQVAGLNDISYLCQKLSNVYETVDAEHFTLTDDILTTLKDSHEGLIGMMDQVAAGLSTLPNENLNARLDQLIQSNQTQQAETAAEAELHDHESAVAEDDVPILTSQIESTLDPELAEIFLDEAREIMNESSELLDAWVEDPQNMQPLSDLQRQLHTLKGGARMAEITAIGDLAHEMETLLEGINEQKLQVTSELEGLLFRTQDSLADMVEAVSEGKPCIPGTDLISEIHTYIAETPDIIEEVEEPEITEALPEIDNEEAQSLETEQAELEGTELESTELESTETTAEADIEEAGIEEDWISEALPEVEDRASLAEPQDQAGIDPELMEIFLEEAEEIIHSSGELIDQWSSSPENMELIGQLQRDLHTLKGGARMAEIAAIGDLAHELENLFEALVEGQIQMDPSFIGLGLQCHDRLAAMVDTLTSGNVPAQADDLIENLKTVLSGEVAEEPLSVEAEGEIQEVQVDEVADEIVEESPELTEAYTEEPEEISASEPVEEQLASFESDLDPELIEIFLEEAMDIVDSTATDLQNWIDNIDDLEIVSNLQRALHTLKGGARMAEISSLGDLAHELENLFEGVSEGKFEVDASIGDLMLQCHDRIASMVDNIAKGQSPAPATDLIDSIHQYLSRSSQSSQADDETIAEGSIASMEDEIDALQTGIDDLHEESDESTRDAMMSGPDDTELLGIFLDEADDICEVMEESIAQWQDEPEQMNGVIELQRELHTLKGGARLTDIDAVADLAEAMYERLDKVLDKELSVIEDRSLELIQEAQKTINSMLASLKETGQVRPARALIAELLNTTLESLDALSEPPVQQPQRQEKVEAPESVTFANDNNAPKATTASDDIDEEVIELFLEEASELLDDLDSQINGWVAEPKNQDFNEALQRLLHTLKGGARLANVKALGDACHNMETTLITAGKKALKGKFLTQIRQYQEQITQLVNEVIERFKSAPAPSVQTPAKDQTVTTGTPAKDKKPAEPGKALKPPMRREKPAAQRVQQQETVRVSANLMDELVNLAGETSITRGRLEQQVSNFSFIIEDMAATIDRLKEQLRRMEIETEAQILFGSERDSTGPDYRDFDPLEMDRYSTLQQLSRALSESSSDLTDLRETLADNVRDAETILLQQSRINTELQEGLMKTRMIPFSSTVPRLRRIVRQISSELGKKVDFDILNAEGEMDRTVLERMIAPLEHMLRNALDHGIETIEKRLAAGKSETGQIRLSLSREGGDILLRMQDDGAGISINAVRKKAISQGMMPEGAGLSDNEVLQFIMQAGFSTAQKVTQISGRGVGMDVVASEIKQLGGNISIDSKEGQGTTFTVRLPFTVSVNRALMVSSGEDFYAIPLNTIEGIVRVSAYELEEYYKPNAPLYEYAGQKYRLKYIGSMLNSEHQPKLQGHPLPLPVILVRGGEQPMALQVDALMGSREIVVKSLGPQFGSVGGVSGATILGDGSVVVILDLPALIRTDLKATLEAELQQQGQSTEGGRKGKKDAYAPQRPTLVMVVDDSVTVRKVTSRLLERNGMEVVTAKDGVDAIAQLQDIKPDLMLLDIEMPRMDGFEVATLVRHDDRLQDVPICMITSRTGQKHRDRAISIGVNKYLGKPFQEKDLLETIEELTSRA